MIDLNPHVKPATRKKYGPLTMSDLACDEMGLLLISHGVLTVCEPQQFGPIVAQTVEGFLSDALFANSEWARRQSVHTTNTVRFTSDDPGVGVVEPIFHLQRAKHGGYQIVSAIEAPLPENYYEERVIEEAKLEVV